MGEYREIVAKIYIKQYRGMKLFALWEIPANTVNYLKTLHKIHFWFNFMFFVQLFNLVMVMQVLTNIDSIEEILNVLFILATSIAISGKLLTVKMKNQFYENFFKLMFQKEYLPRNSAERKLFLQCINLNTKVRNVYTQIACCSCTFLIITQLFSGTKELPVNVYSPFGLDANWKYNTVYIYVCLCLTVGCLSTVLFDTLASSFFIHLKGQLDMLAHRLENIGKNTKSATQDFILQELKDCVRDYNRILMMSHDIEYLVSGPISLQFGCSVFILIANFYVMSTLSASGDIVKFINVAVYQAVMLSQIFMLCYFANEITLTSSELAFHLYTTDWYNWNRINRKLVLLMLLRFKIPIRISSINRCYSFNLAAFTSTVNSAYSYFALLNRTDN